MQCPKCHKETSSDRVCGFCGISFNKYRERVPQPAASGEQPGSEEYWEVKVAITALVADDPLGEVAKQKMEFRMRDFYKRLLWTLALLGFWSIVRHFPLPGTNSGEHIRVKSFSLHFVFSYATVAPWLVPSA